MFKKFNLVLTLYSNANLDGRAMNIGSFFFYIGQCFRRLTDRLSKAKNLNQSFKSINLIPGNVFQGDNRAFKLIHKLNCGLK